MDHFIDNLPAPDDDLSDHPVSPFDPSLNVLVIDRSVVTRTRLARLLEKMGHHIRHAEDEAQAIDVFKRLRFDIVLIDVGFETALALISELRSKAGDRCFPIVGITSPSEEVTDQSADLDVNGYIRRPFSATDLRKIIDELVFGSNQPVDVPFAAAD